MSEKIPLKEATAQYVRHGKEVRSGVDSTASTTFDKKMRDRRSEEALANCQKIKERLARQCPPLPALSQDQMPSKKSKHGHDCEKEKHPPRTQSDIEAGYKGFVATVTKLNYEERILKAARGEPAEYIEKTILWPLRNSCDNLFRRGINGITVTDTHRVEEYVDALHELVSVLLSGKVRGRRKDNTIGYSLPEEVEPA